MADVTAHVDFTGKSNTDVRLLARTISQGGRHAARHAKLAARRNAVPDRYFEQITAQNDRFSAIGDTKGLLHGPFISDKMLDLRSELTDSAEVPEDALEGLMAARGPVEVSAVSTSWSGSLVSLALHSAMAALLLAIGLTVEIPKVEGETSIAITIIGDAPDNEMAASSAPVAVEPEVEPEVVPPVSEFKPSVAARPEMAVPQQALIATTQPSMTSTVLPQKLPEVAEPKPLPPKLIEKPLPQQSPAKAQDVPKTVAKIIEPPKKPAVAKLKKPVSKTPVKKPAIKAAAKAAAQPSDKSANAAGKGKVNTRKGAADGVEKGKTQAKSAGNTVGKTGDAAASNYAGLVQRKIARTRQRPAGGHGNVVVSFSISASGGIAGASIPQSSGTPAVDAAALDHVRRSAPFPAPPAGAQTHFQIPITIR